MHKNNQKTQDPKAPNDQADRLDGKPVSKTKSSHNQTKSVVTEAARSSSVQRLVRRFLNGTYDLEKYMDACLVNAEADNYKLPLQLTTQMQNLKTAIKNLTLDDIQQLVKSQCRQ